MAKERAGFVNVEQLMSEASLEQAVAYYGVMLPEIHRVGNEIRMRCFLNCGRTVETGDRALSIQAEHPAKIWRCHQYGCGRGGNLISLCDFLKPGPHAEGKPRGERFKAIIADLMAMTRNELAPAIQRSGFLSQPDVTEQATPKPQPKKNPPLAECDNERARALVSLDEKFVVDVAQMSPRASSYFRSRPFLTPEVCRKWRVGYLPRDAGGERAGGTMRGKIAYPMLSESGEVLTWFGRDPEFEAKHQAWIAGGRQEREPEKFHFVKGFHRGAELFGQHSSRLREPGYRKHLREIGLVVVEGPNDVIALDCLGMPAVGLCSNSITVEQVRKLVQWARQFADGRVVLMLDCDEEGEKGARLALCELAQHCDVRLAWSSEMRSGAFKGRQPESLRGEEWEQIRASLARGGVEA